VYVFHYDPWTRVYAGSEPGEFDRLEPGRMIVPGAATPKPPPPARDGFVRVFDVQQDTWAYQSEAPAHG
jgi:hypothetical protein